jgi:hypothetical protein
VWRAERGCGVAGRRCAEKCKEFLKDFRSDYTDVSEEVETTKYMAMLVRPHAPSLSARRSSLASTCFREPCTLRRGAGNATAAPIDVWLQQQHQDWFLKCLLGGGAHPLAACGVAALCCSAPRLEAETLAFRKPPPRKQRPPRTAYPCRVTAGLCG